MNKIVYQYRYDKNLTIAEIAQALRDEITQAVEVELFPVATYEVEDAEGAAYIRVTVKDFVGVIFNRRALELDYDLGSEVIGNEQYKILQLERTLTPKLDFDLDWLLKRLSRMANQWRYDGSGIVPVELFNYGCTVNIDAEQASVEFDRLTEEIRIEKTSE